MGRKGTSKRKPKQIKQTTVAATGGNSLVQDLVKSKNAPLQKTNEIDPMRWKKKK